MIMSAKAETYTLNQVKELLPMHENALLNVLNSTTDRLDKNHDIKHREKIDKFEGKCLIPQ